MHDAEFHLLFMSSIPRFCGLRSVRWLNREYSSTSDVFALRLHFYGVYLSCRMICFMYFVFFSFIYYWYLSVSFIMADALVYLFCLFFFDLLLIFIIFSRYLLVIFNTQTHVERKSIVYSFHTFSYRGYVHTCLYTLHVIFFLWYTLKNTFHLTYFEY